MGYTRTPDGRFRFTPIAAALLLALGLGTVPAYAEDDAAPASKKDKMTELLDKLKAKGIISDEEYDELSGNTPEARAEARAERRRQATREANEVQKAESAKERYNGRWNNGITFATPDNRNSFNISGRVHADYRYFDENTAPSGFDVRRAYLTLSGKWNEWLTWDVTGDFAQPTTSVAGTQQNGGSILDVAWVNAAYSDALQFRMGQFKMPFSMEQLQSSRFIDFQERALMDALIPAKERGLMVHGAPFLGATYGLALSNGQGKNGNELNPRADTPDVIGRVTYNFAEALNQQARAVYHIGLAGSVGDLPFNTTAQAATTEARGYQFFTVGSFGGDNVRRERIGVEGALAYGPVKLQSQWVQVNYEGKNGTTEYDKSISSWYASLMWMVTGERYAESYRNGVFGRMIPIQNYTPGGSSWGAWELGLRYSQWDGSDFQLANANNNTGVIVTTLTAPNVVTKAQAITVGLKWIWTPNFKIYFNYVDTKFGAPITVTTAGPVERFTTDRERALTMRAAFDF